ncbi:hypothetical protein ACFQ1S_43225, partial [Kibdelosporangium lantanae]
MSDLLDIDNGDEFDAWLVRSNANLTRRTSQSLDIDGMLVTVRKEAESRSQSMLRPTVVSGSDDTTDTTEPDSADEPDD